MPRSTSPAKVRQGQENPRQSFLAGIEKAIHQFLFVADDAGNETPHE